jgi:hypothetical protein
MFTVHFARRTQNIYKKCPFYLSTCLQYILAKVPFFSLYFSWNKRYLSITKHSLVVHQGNKFRFFCGKCMDYNNCCQDRTLYAGESVTGVVPCPAVLREMREQLRKERFKRFYVQRVVTNMNKHQTTWHNTLRMLISTFQATRCHNVEVTSIKSSAVCVVSSVRASDLSFRFVFLCAFLHTSRGACFYPDKM